MTAHKVYTGGALYPVVDTPVSAIAALLVLIASVVMFVTWLGALIRLGQLHSWGWFVAVFALSMVGMLAYAVAGPPDEMIVTRPTVT